MFEDLDLKIAEKKAKPQTVCPAPFMTLEGCGKYTSACTHCPPCK